MHISCCREAHLRATTNIRVLPYQSLPSAPSIFTIIYIDLNADLVNRLNAEPSKMEESGEIETIRNQTIENYMKRLNTGALKFW